MLVKEIMTTNVISVNKDSLVGEAIDLMVEHNVSGLPVIDDHRELVGILTETDLVIGSKKFRHIYYYPSFFPLADVYKNNKTIEEKLKKLVETKVEKVMTKKVLVVNEEDSIDNVVSIMAENEVHRVPVVNQGKLVGIISQRDIIKAYGKMKLTK
ncbi:CBS domain-containing protein [Alkaliphilus serpentinus]|uniref:CBS domain-containing protein n=1 Tax=Alkaliphilus serpentinus TaxID=1482731 RepID=A0A833HNQ9_9FIRM|nr:CBS domain-containing protein [Alkaliphilus serpentinus]KAB3529994.1 CBS domain-containing protein [Alkaliphilus serpentinus]